MLKVDQRSRAFRFCLIRSEAENLGTKLKEVLNFKRNFSDEQLQVQNQEIAVILENLKRNRNVLVESQLSRQTWYCLSDELDLHYLFLFDNRVFAESRVPQILAQIQRIVKSDSELFLTASTRSPVDFILRPATPESFEPDSANCIWRLYKPEKRKKCKFPETATQNQPNHSVLGRFGARRRRGGEGTPGSRRSQKLASSSHQSGRRQNPQIAQIVWFT